MEVTEIPESPGIEIIFSRAWKVQDCLYLFGVDPDKLSQAVIVCFSLGVEPEPFVLGEHLIEASGKLVLILQADPGYDWLFGHGIAGLITQYGGANSHMAIRAAEIGLPAAIGVGEKLYEKILNMRQVELDCANHIIREIQ